MKTPERILDETHEDYHRYQLDIHEHGLPDIAAMETYAKQMVTVLRLLTQSSRARGL